MTEKLRGTSPLESGDEISALMVEMNRFGTTLRAILADPKRLDELEPQEIASITKAFKMLNDRLETTVPVLGLPS